MGVTEIVLIIIGAVVLILGYVLPSGSQEETETTLRIDEGLIKELIEKEIADEKNHINDMVDETLSYSMEKTERQMERLTNEKIMAVNEYSDSVLESIHKNHQEVMFLYDMLNDKHDNLVKTVGEASVKAKEIKQTVQDAEITVREALEVAEAGAEAKAEAEARAGAWEEPVAEEQESTFVPINPPKVEVIREVPGDGADSGEAAEAEASQEGEGPVEEEAGNHNERILHLHQLGKSPKAIAKELSLGVGEVKLVIDLFKQAK